MKKLLSTVLVLSSSIAMAVNAAPFGQEIGVAKCSDVIKQLSDKVDLKEGGINKYTNGEMYGGDAKNLGLDGAKSILIVCDKNNTLTVVQIKIDKDAMNNGFEKYNKMLKSKYKQTKLINPSVGDKLAKFSQGDSTVQLYAPHMSFEMDLTYAANSFLKSFNANMDKERSNQQKQQTQNL